MRKVRTAWIRSRVFRANVLTALLAVTISCRRSEMADDRSTVSGDSELARTNIAIERKIEAIRRAGFPVEMDELDRWLPTAPNDSENAAQIWTNVAAMVLPPPRIGRLPERCEALDAATNHFLRRVLATNHVQLRKMHVASTLQSSRYPLSWAGGFASNGGFGRDWDWAMNAVWLLQVEATVSSEDQRMEAALDSLSALTSLARGLAKPDAADLTQSGMVLLAACGSAERLLGRNALTIQQLRKLQDIFRSAPNSDGLTRHLAVLRCYVYFQFKHWREQIVPYLKAINEVDHGQPESPDALDRVVTDFAGKKDANLLCFLEEMEHLADCPLPRCSELRY